MDAQKGSFSVALGSLRLFAAMLAPARWRQSSLFRLIQRELLGLSADSRRSGLAAVDFLIFHVLRCRYLSAQ